jgi:predicted transport protein
LWIQKSAIHIHLLRVQAKDLQDPEKRVEDVQNSMKYFNKYISNVKIESPDQIDY